MFRRFLNSVTKIFDLPAWFQTIPSTSYDADSGLRSRVVAALLLVGALVRVRSFEELERGARRGRFRRFGAGPMSADTIRRWAKTIPPQVWHTLCQQVGRTLARNRAWDRIGGLREVALDGVELFVQHSVTCDDCLHRTIDGVTQWFHRIIVASTVGPHRQTVLEWEPIHPADGSDKNEGEPTAAYRLLDTLYHAYHHQIEVIVADALYTTRVFLEAVRAHGWDVVVRLKDNRLTILKDAQGLLKITPASVVRALNDEVLRIWDFSDLSWGSVHNLRVIYWERTVTIRRRGRLHREQVATKTWTGWALATCGPAVTALTVYQIMHHRWDLENCVFRQGKTTGHLAHCFGHDPAIIEAMIGAQLVAITLWNWWTTRQTVSARRTREPRVAWVDDAREDLRTMRTAWVLRWSLIPI